MVDECFFRSLVDGVAGEADQTVVGAVELQFNAVITELVQNGMLHVAKKEASAVDREHRNEQLGNSSLVEILCQVEVPHPEIGVGQACHESLNQKCLPHTKLS